jgi:tetratricopeptide (TPR) repeat protein
LDVKDIIEQAAQAGKTNHLNQAFTILRDGLKSNPNDPQLIANFALVHEKLKKFPEAHTLYSKLVSKEGKAPPPVAIGMARSLIGMSRYAQALKLLQPLFKQFPKNPEVLVATAQCEMHRKNYENANKLIARALNLAPDHKTARHVKAQLQIAGKSDQAAIETLEANLDRPDLHGDSIDLWMQTLFAQKRELYLLEKLREYTGKYPARPEFEFGLGFTYSRLGAIENARNTLTSVSKKLPNNPKILYELGVMERIAGNIEVSQAYLDQVLDLSPEHPAALRTYGVDYKYSYGDKVFARLNTVAANITTMKLVDQVQMHFALGKAFDDVVEYNSAFQHYAVGGGKRKKEHPYKEASSARMFDIMKQLVTRESMEKQQPVGSQDSTPVFILGMPRSGTSLMEQVLSSHPDIYGAGELKYMTSALENIDVLGRRLKLGDVESAFEYDKNASYADRGDWYVNELKKLAEQPYRRIVDKMPGNFNFVGLIAALLPNARIIHSQRHPVETCLSCYRIHFAEGHQWSYDLRELGRYYRRYWELMQHWRENFPGLMHEVRYEDNVNDLETQARKLIGYLDLEWNDDCLRFYETDRPVKTASASQVRRPIYKTSTNRWRKYEAHLKPLLEEIGDIVEIYESQLGSN